MLLTATDLAMRYGARRLFERLSFEVRRGEPLAVVGDNGAGKSTLLRVLAGVLTPVAGTVQLHVGGQAVPSEHLPLNVGFAAPALQLYEPFTARENLAFLAAARRLPDAPERVAETLRQVDLAHRADEPVAAFSTGMRQRLRLAAALLHQPTLLLLDEPGATLDAPGRALVASIVASDALVVVATNDPDEAALCPRRLTLTSGMPA
jgi:heme exporter protein A